MEETKYAYQIVKDFLIFLISFWFQCAVQAAIADFTVEDYKHSRRFCLKYF